MVKLNDLKKPAPCKFCYQKKDGGVDLLSTKADLGELGTLEAGVSMWDCILNDYPSSIHLWMWLNTSENDGEQLGNEVKFNIKYCPMCGKELNQ